MKRIAIIMLILACLLVSCSKEQPETTKTPTEEIAESTTAERGGEQLPRGLEGTWVSATVDERGYSESITFNADGSLLVSSLKNGKAEKTIYGTFYTEGDKIIFEITAGATPYEDHFEYTLDGRELYLIDDDGPAHYLRTS